VEIVLRFGGDVRGEFGADQIRAPGAEQAGRRQIRLLNHGGGVQCQVADRREIIEFAQAVAGLGQRRLGAAKLLILFFQQFDLMGPWAHNRPGNLLAGGTAPIPGALARNTLDP